MTISAQYVDGLELRIRELSAENATLRQALKNHAEEAVKMIAAAPKPEGETK